MKITDRCLKSLEAYRKTTKMVSDDTGLPRKAAEKHLRALERSGIVQSVVVGVGRYVERVWFVRAVMVFG
jgi:predicted transcriptional regulator